MELVADYRKQRKQDIHDAMITGITAASIIVKDAAVLLAPVDKHELRDGIDYEIRELRTEIEGHIGTNVFHARFVEFGTGEFAENGQGRKGYWVFVEGEENLGGTGGKTYTLDEARQAMAYLRSIGLEAYYTRGQSPQPFLRPAFRNNKKNIEKAIKIAFKRKFG